MSSSKRRVRSLRSPPGWSIDGTLWDFFYWNGEEPLQPGDEITPNVLSLCLQPDEGIHLAFEAKEPGVGMRAKQVDMEFHYAEDFEESSS